MSRAFQEAYQRRFVEEQLPAAWKAGHKSVLLVLPVSAGKTRCARLVIQRHARAQGVSAEAILRHVRRMTHMQYDERVSTAVGLQGFAGVSLGRVELPASDTGTLRGDGWRAHTVGENSVVPAVRRGDGPHVWDGGEDEQRGGTLREIKGRW